MNRQSTFLGLAFVLLLGLVSYAALPQLINFQGILKDGSGNPVANGSYSVTFKIYDAPTGGTVLWTETQPVTTTNGLFTVLLGATSPVPDSTFNDSSRFLGITVSPDPEMTPRQQLVSLSYSYRVSSVDGALGGNILTKVSIGPGHVNTGTNALAAGENNRARGNYSVVSGGGGPSAADSNSAAGDWAGVHGGTGNTASGLRAFIGGGFHNTSSASDATVGGGFINTASGPGATVAGGGYNTASGFDATVGGGDSHVASGNFATVAGGWRDTANAIYATIGGGWGNNAADSAATVAGGRANRAGGRYAIVGGGMGNTANGYGASVSGGISNSAASLWSTVGGGIYDTATGAYANVAGGGYNIANGSAATVGGGVNNKALVGNSTIGGGTGNTANGGAATVGGGQFNQATAGFATVAGGGGNTAGASAFVGGGSSNTATGGNSTIGGGYLNVASGNYSTIGGGETDTVQGYNATVPGGRYNKASGDYSLAAGYRAKALHNGTFVWADEPGVFGTDFASTGFNQFLIRAAGGVGINTNDPNEALTIGGSMEVGTGAGDYQHLRIGGGNSSGFLYGSYPKYGDGIHIGYNYYANTVGNNVIPNLGGATSRLSLGYGYIGMFVGGVSGEPATLGVYVNSLGNVGVGTGAPAYRLDVAGSAHATSFPTSSDIRLKKNIEPLTNVLEKIEKIRGVSFDWNETYEKMGRSSGHREIGFIAQDVESVFPELVTKWGEKDYRAVDYGRMTAVLIEAVKELKAENEELKDRISKLEKNGPQAKIEE